MGQPLPPGVAKMDEEMTRVALTLLRHNVGMHRAAALLGTTYPTLKKGIDKTRLKPVTITVLVPEDYDDHIPKPEVVHKLLGKKSPGRFKVERILKTSVKR